jgi:hypothetical protein
MQKEVAGHRQNVLGLDPQTADSENFGAVILRR